MSAIGSPSMVFPGNVTMSYHLSLDESTTQVEYEVCYSTHSTHPQVPLSLSPSQVIQICSWKVARGLAVRVLQFIFAFKCS